MTTQTYFNARLPAYGAKADGVTDDWAAITAAGAAAMGSGSVWGANYNIGRTLLLPYSAAGYYISQPLVFPKTRGLRIIADPGTKLIYGGSATADGVIIMEGYANTVSGLHIMGTANVGVRMTHFSAAATWISSYCTFADLEFTGSFTHNISLDTRGGTLINNNEYHLIEGCIFKDYGKRGARGAGVHVFGSQSHANLVTGCTFFGDDRGATKTGVWCEYGSHIHVEDNYFEANQRDVMLSDFFQVYNICRNKSRNSSRFAIISLGASGSTSPATIIGNDVDHGAYLGATDTFGNPSATISIKLAGPTKVIGNTFTASNANPMLYAAGSEFESRSGLEFGANKFRGSASYFGAQTSVPSVPTIYQAGFDSDSSFVHYCADHGTNRYYNISTGKYESLGVQTILEAYGLANEDSDIIPLTLRGYTDFPDAGGQTQNAVLRTAEPDTDYRPRITGIETLTGTVPDGTVAKIDAGKTTTDFPMKLDTAPVGWGARVYWEIERTA